MKSQPAIFFKFLLVLAVIAVGGSAIAQCLDTHYHTRADIDAFVTALRDSDAVHNHIVHVDTIGWSRGDQLGIHYPLYCIKVSTHPDTFVDQPTALLVGHIHAEEVVGLETMISLLWDMVTTHYGLYRTLIQNTQLYFVPTMNPDGLEIVSRNWDCTYRKNGYRPSQLDTCIVVPGVGGDSCGVDLNRNADFNWIYGDTLWYPTALERFDYYRGPGPLSEPESQAITELARRIQPTVSAVFHLSRAGGNSERSICAWGWQEDTGGAVKASPDCTAIGFLNNLYVDEYPTTEAGERYHAAFHSTRNGEWQDWFYRELGTVQFNTELGPRGPNIQPPNQQLDSIITLFKPAFSWLLNRNLNIDHATQTPVTIHTYIAGTQTPISAEWRYLNTWNALLDPWYTNAQYGSATSLLIRQGNARIMARKEGYADTTINASVNPNGAPQNFNLYLRALPSHTLTLRLYDSSGSPITGRVYLDAEFPHWVNVSVAGSSITLPEGSFRARAMASNSGPMVLWRDFYLGGDGTQAFYLPPGHQLFSENFEGGLGNWTAGGIGNPWRLDQDTTAMNFGSCLCNAPAGYRAQYDDTLNATLTCNQAISLVPDTNNVAYMTMWRRGRLDMPADSFFVEVEGAADTAWAIVAGYSDLELPWTQSWINLSRWMGQSIQVRFRFMTDATLGDLGLDIDNVAVYIGTDLAAPQRPAAAAYTYRITGSYPNPFNPSTTITYEVARPGLVKLVLFNTLGQEVRRFNVDALAAGPQHLMWDGTSASGSAVSSGIYFVQLQAGHTIATHKLLLLR